MCLRASFGRSLSAVSRRLTTRRESLFGLQIYVLVLAKIARNNSCKIYKYDLFCQARKDKHMFFGIRLKAFSVVLSSAKQSWSFQNFIDFPCFFKREDTTLGFQAETGLPWLNSASPRRLRYFGCFKRSRPIAFLVSYREAFESKTTAARRFSDLGVALFQIG